MTTAIAHYPVHLIEVVRLAGGGRVTLRPTLPQDAELLRAFFGSLSAEARYGRFLTRCNAVPESLVERFSNIDYRNHLALMAAVREGGRETMIGEARYEVDASDPAACEFAIAVADPWQWRGIGTAMLGRLERHAAACGARRMVADTMVSNAAMLGLARSRGFAIRASRDHQGLASLEKHLNPSVAPLAARSLAA